MTVNKQWIYARKPASEVGPDNFDLRESAVPEPKPGEVLVKTTLLSLDPASRAWMQGATYRSQLNPGDVMAGWGLGEVVASQAKGFEPGDLVSGEYGWQQYAALPARALSKHDKKHKPEHILGALGITGLTAYFGMLDVGRPRPGETVLVSGAAGRVTALVTPGMPRLYGSRRWIQWAIAWLTRFGRARSALVLGGFGGRRCLRRRRWNDRRSRRGRGGGRGFRCRRRSAVDSLDLEALLG